MPFYLGVDFHAHQQMVAWCDTPFMSFVFMGILFIRRLR